MKRIALALFVFVAATCQAQAGTPVQKKTDSTAILLANRHVAQPSQATLQLQQAILNSNIELADMLLTQGGDIDCMGCAALTIMLLDPMSGDAPNKRLDWMLAHGANVNVHDHYGRTPLMVMLARGINIYWSNARDTAALPQHGADPTLSDNEGFQALHYLAQKAPPIAGPFGEMNKEISETNAVFATLTNALVERGANINAASGNGTTPLMNIARSCNPSALNLFLSLGADAKARNAQQENALKIAIDKAVQYQSKNCNAVVTRLNASS